MGEFLGLLCSLYLIFMTAVLPLYTGGTYWQLGDTKYILFRNVSVLVTCVWMVLTLGRGLRSAAAGKKNPQKNLPGLSAVDLSVLAYLAAILLSALLSPYRQIAWTGYPEWYMGALSQCMFVAIYFLVSRSYGGGGYPIYVGEGALAVVFLIGFANRLGLDPLRLMMPFGLKDWEYSHMISTIGNINWFCGFCCVMLGFPAAGYLKAERKAQAVLLYILTVSGLVLLDIQGSDAGPLAAAVCLGVIFLYGLKDRVIFQKGLALSAGMFLTLTFYGRIAKWLGPEAVLSVPADGIGFAKMSWGGWWGFGILFLGLTFLFGRLSAKSADRAGSIAMAVMALGAAATAALYGFSLPGGDGWGSGRGGLWRFAWQGFWQGGLRQKLTGAGPDCFAPYIYGTLPADVLTPVEGFWTGTIYANAHNEWLNALVTLGVIGTVSLGAVFVTGFRRYRKIPFGILILSMYGVNSLVSFQQVLSTPFLFMALGLCENAMRSGSYAGSRGRMEGDGEG